MEQLLRECSVFWFGREQAELGAHGSKPVVLEASGEVFKRLVGLAEGGVRFRIQDGQQRQANGDRVGGVQAEGGGNL